MSKPIVWSIYGHQKQKRILERLVLSQAAQGTYLFSGPKHVGKTTAAVDTARALLCRADGQLSSATQTRPCKVCVVCKMPLESNPDLLFIDRAEEEISIADIRQLQTKMSLKAFSGGQKVVILAAAENLNPEAANALLKFLEEPEPKTIIFLITSRPQSLPQTIVSRSRYLRFGFPEEAAVEEFYARLNSKPEFKQLRLLCGPRLGLAAQVYTDSDFKDAFFKAAKELQTILDADIKTRLEFADTIKDIQARELYRLLSQWLIFLENELAVTSSFKAISSFARRAERLAAAIRDIDFNLNKKLVLENLLLNL